jgi:hypothetical protein
VVLVIVVSVERNATGIDDIEEQTCNKAHVSEEHLDHVEAFVRWSLLIWLD